MASVFSLRLATLCHTFSVTADYSNFKVGWSCEDPENAPVLNIARENYGQESRCFRQGDEWVVKNSTGAVISTQGRFGAGCYQFRCSGLRLFIDVKGSSKEVRCGKKGQKKHVTVEENGLTYEGTLICPDYDELCSTYDCLNLCSGHGTCTNGSCKCQPGYFGDDCSEVACQNGSSCHDTEAGFSCICPSGRTGAYCESELVPDPCVGVNCNGNGVCFRTRLGRQFECQCYDGYTGKECNDILDLCTEAEIPCRHGTCVNTTTPMCECEPFYFGPQCDERTEYCTPDPCENGGTCINCPEESTYECSCPHTHEGENCETKILDPCEETSCLSNQTCERINNFRFRCTCPEGYEGDSCEKKIDYCADSPCLNGGTCINHETLYECVCPRGYKGRRCKNRRNPCIPDPCLHGRCQKDENGPYGQIYCECEEGHRGEFCEDKIPTCFPNPCRNGGTCTEYGGGNILCTCPPGYDDGMYCEGPVCPLGLSGQNCSDPVPELPQFSGNSHLFLSAPHESALTSFIITVSVKPQQPNGLIFLRCLDGNKDGDFISIGLKEGIVEFRFDPRTGPAVIRSHRVLEMNQWHIVTATRHSRNGSLYVNTDPNYPASGVSKGAFVHMNLERSVIYIGGYSNVSTLPDRFGEYTSGFHGCVSHLEVNGHMLDIVANSTKTNVNQCKDSGPCSKTFNACELGGRCRASDTDYWCECRPGYSGISCNSSVVPAEPSFNGQSYLAMEATSGSFLNINISITLTPISGDGLILLIATDSMKPGDFVAVGLNSSTVEFYFNQMDISSDDFYVESSQKLVTGSRNTVTLLKRGAEGSVQVNQGLVAHGVTIGPHRFLHVSDQALVYIGGHPTWDTVPQSIENYDSGFHGCIHQVVLNERLLDLTQACSSRQTSECILPSGT